MRFGRLRHDFGRAPGLVHVLLAALLLLAPVAMNGRPAVFFDTIDYLHEGEATLAMANLSLPGLDLDPPTSPSRQQYAVWRSIRASRSAAYGVFAYVSSRLGGLWLTAALQALAASGVIYGFVAAVAGPGRRDVFWAIILTTTLASALPFYCGFLMPDLGAGLGVLAAVALACGATQLGRLARAAMFLGAVVCASLHTSHVLTLIALGAAAAMSRLVRTRELGQAARAGAWPLAAAICAIAMFGGFSALVQARTGELLRSPPFLSARLLMDGPGRRYLAAACAHGRRPFTLCDFKSRRLTVGDDILWSRDPRIGVFATVDAAARTRLSEEDRGFAYAVLRADPLGVAAIGARNAIIELGSLRIVDPLRSATYFMTDGFWRNTALAWVAPGAAQCTHGVARCRSRFHSGDFLVLHWLAYAGAAGFLAWRLTRRDARLTCCRREAPDEFRSRALEAACLLVVAVFVNAAICGALSGPYDRYQARVAWLMIAAAITTAGGLGLRRIGAQVVTDR